MDDSTPAAQDHDQSPMSIEEMSMGLARKLLAQKSADSWRAQSLMAISKVESSVRSLMDWADQSSLDGRSAWDRFNQEISGITWDHAGGGADVELYFSCRGCNGTSRIRNVAKSADLENALWRAACDTLARAHPWLWELEPLTAEELASGKYEVEGDGGRSFMQGLGALGPDGLVFAQQVARRRDVMARIRDLEREWTAGLSVAVGSKAFPVPVKNVAGALAVKLKAMFMADGSFMIGVDSVVKKNGRSMSGQSFARSSDECVPLGSATAPERELWNAFSTLLVDRMSKSWTEAEIDECVPAAEALVLREQVAALPSKMGRTPRM